MDITRHVILLRLHGGLSSTISFLEDRLLGEHLRWVSASDRRNVRQLPLLRFSAAPVDVTEVHDRPGPVRARSGAYEHARTRRRVFHTF